MYFIFLVSCIQKILYCITLLFNIVTLLNQCSQWSIDMRFFSKVLFPTSAYTLALIILLFFHSLLVQAHLKWSIILLRTKMKLGLSYLFFLKVCCCMFLLVYWHVLKFQRVAYISFNNLGSFWTISLKFLNKKLLSVDLKVNLTWTHYNLHGK